MSSQVLSIKESTILSAAGEYYVLSRLCLAGYIAALAPKGVPNTDIVITDINSSRLFAVQVKSRLDKGQDKGWHMKRKHEQIVSDWLFYCFVDFGDGLGSAPTTFVVPSKVVAEAIATTHMNWLFAPGRNGRQHNDSEVRRLVPDYSVYLKEKAGKYCKGWLEPYREAWHLFRQLNTRVSSTGSR